MILQVVIVVATILLLTMVVGAAIVGLLGALTGGRIERCSRCGHFTLVVDGTAHEHGCPTSYGQHLAQFGRDISARLHGGHALHFRRPLHFKHR